MSQEASGTREAEGCLGLFTILRMRSVNSLKFPSVLSVDSFAGWFFTGSIHFFMA